MQINLSSETIETVYNSLRGSKQGLEYQLKYGIPNKKVSPDRKKIIEHQLAEVEDALAVFEELMNRL